MPPKLISIIVPVYNEEKNISLVYKAIVTSWQNLKNRYLYEIIFVDDGSTDGSILEIKKLLAKEKNVSLIEFSRNFGKEAATSAGLREAKGEATLLFDADLQYPASLIPDFIKKWEEGIEIVIGIRSKKSKESLGRRVSSAIFYVGMKILRDNQTPPRSTDFRLLDKKVVTAFCNLTESDGMTRGLIDWLGFRRDFIEFEATPRANGSSSYKTGKRLKLAISALVAQSFFPLRFAGYLGILITTLSGFFGLFMISQKYIWHDPFHLNFSGTAFLAILIIFLVGIILICLGLIALYIANIHSQVSRRPMYIIRK